MAKKQRISQRPDHLVLQPDIEGCERQLRAPSDQVQCYIDPRAGTDDRGTFVSKLAAKIQCEDILVLDDQDMVSFQGP